MRYFVGFSKNIQCGPACQTRAGCVCALYR